MKDRILKFLEHEHISPAEFADKIGVQRSSMSHILNGRNYPSAAFIQKMLQAFPMVNSRWLLIGDGKMNIYPDEMNLPTAEDKKSNSMSSETISELKSYKEQEGNSVQNLDFWQGSNNQANIQSGQPVITKEESVKDTTIEVEQKTPNIFSKTLSAENQPVNISTSAINAPEEKEIEQILFFYRDKTFSIYRPS